MCCPDRPTKYDPAEGPQPTLVWPLSLVNRPSPVLLIYLDLNHWIGLSKAATSHPVGRSLQGVHHACLEARRAGAALFPLSDAHYIEVSKIANSRQRKELAAVMEDLSGFTTLLSRPDVMRLEVDAALAALLKAPCLPLPALPLLGPGVFWAFGRRGLRIRDGDEDITDRFRQEFPDRYDQLFRRSERGFLAGPSDSQIPVLKAKGWKPDAGWQVATKWAEQEREQAACFDANDRWRRGRIRDVILARELIFEIWDMLFENLAARSYPGDSLQGDRERACRIVQCMPSSEVSTELKVAAHRNPQTKWTPNDMMDIEAMSLSVPYCDVVVTEKRACHTLRRAHLDERMGTTILDNLMEPALGPGESRQRAGVAARLTGESRGTPANSTLLQWKHGCFGGSAPAQAFGLHRRRRRRLQPPRRQPYSTQGTASRVQRYRRSGLRVDGPRFPRTGLKLILHHSQRSLGQVRRAVGSNDVKGSCLVEVFALLVG